jgi:hypothetical protein
MFESVIIKFGRAEYFLNQLTKEDVGHQPWRANLDAFFFELVSTKEFFLQAINDKYGLGLKKDHATDFKLLKENIKNKGQVGVLQVIGKLEKEFIDKNSWLWRLNNYRNSAMHRELLHLGYVSGVSDHVEVHLFRDPEDSSRGNDDLEVIPYCQKSFKDLKAYLEILFNQLA